MPTPATHRFEHLTSAYGSVLRSGAYRPLWLSQLVSNFGDSLHYIALVVLVFEMTGRGVSVAGLVAAEIMPVLLLGPVAGVVIDRVDRKWVLIGADLFRAILVLSLLWPRDSGTSTWRRLVSPPGTRFSTPQFRRSSRYSPARISDSRLTR
jgi:hypothetical protein